MCYIQHIKRAQPCMSMKHTHTTSSSDTFNIMFKGHMCCSSGQMHTSQFGKISTPMDVSSKHTNNPSGKDTLRGVLNQGTTTHPIVC